MNIKFNGIAVKYNEIKTKKETVNKPILELAKTDKYITIIMVDPDAPTKEIHTNRYWLHWLIINNDKTINEYNGPNPPIKSGNHRYFILIFEQDNKINLDNEIPRAKFNLMKFIEINKLKLITYIKFNVIG